MPGEPKEFEPFVFYNKDGDCVEAFFSSSSYYGKWISHDLTLYLDDETDEVVGCEISGISRMVGR